MSAWTDAENTKKEIFKKYKDNAFELSSLVEVTASTLGFKLCLWLTAEAFVTGNDQDYTAE